MSEPEVNVLNFARTCPIIVSTTFSKINSGIDILYVKVQSLGIRIILSLFISIVLLDIDIIEYTNVYSNLWLSLISMYNNR